MYVDISRRAAGVRSVGVGRAEKGIQQLGDAGGVHGFLDCRLLIVDGDWGLGNGELGDELKGYYYRVYQVGNRLVMSVSRGLELSI